MVLEARNVAQSQNSVPWLERNASSSRPGLWLCRSARHADAAINEQLIVELYSK